MKGKKWDVYVYGDVNIDLVVPGVSSLPKPGQEDEVPVMDTYVGGGAALFAMALGMGAPLVIVGVLARSALPKPGPWMEGVRRAFGVMLLAVAVWLVSPVLPSIVPMLAWAGLLIFSAIYLHALDPLPSHAAGWQRFWKGVGVLALIAGAALFIGLKTAGILQV